MLRSIILRFSLIYSITSSTNIITKILLSKSPKNLLDLMQKMKSLEGFDTVPEIKYLNYIICI